MKRLYVRPQYRRQGTGRLLVLAAIDAAGSLGYEVLRLDTVGVFKTAPALLQQLGFEEIPPFDSLPSWLEGGMRAFQLLLTPAANREI